MLTCRHAFFTRKGGVSQGNHSSLNFNKKDGDSPENILKNRRLIAQFFAIQPSHLITLDQVHSNKVIHISEVSDYSNTQADALITTLPNVAIGSITGDCAPILLQTTDGTIIGAAHAGWRGAVSGIIENTCSAIRDISKQPIIAAIGPCIQQFSYEVDIAYKKNFLNIKGSEATRFFEPKANDKYDFNLPGFCQYILQDIGIDIIDNLEIDTVTNPDDFFSYRRKTILGEATFGCQLSAIARSI